MKNLAVVALLAVAAFASTNSFAFSASDAAARLGNLTKDRVVNCRAQTGANGATFFRCATHEYQPGGFVQIKFWECDPQRDGCSFVGKGEKVKY